VHIAARGVVDDRPVASERLPTPARRAKMHGPGNNTGVCGISFGANDTPTAREENTMVRTAFKTAAVGVAATAAAAMGGVLTAPAAAAAPGVAPPGLTVEQGQFEGGNVQVTTHNPNDPVTACAPVRVAGETALNALVDYANDDTAALVEDLSNGDVAVGELAYDYSNIPWVGKKKDPSVTTWQVDDGVYLVAGVCKQLGWHDIGAIIGGDYKKLLDPQTTAFTMEPLIVPDGIGSIAPAAEFGGLLLQTPEALSALSSDGLLEMFLDNAAPAGA